MFHLISPLFGQEPLSRIPFAEQRRSFLQIPDDSALREAIKDQWLTETPAKVLRNKSFTHTLPGGGTVQVRTESRGNEFMVILARQREGVSGSGEYPGWARGSWILTRFINTGDMERIRVFLHSDPRTYIQFRPMEPLNKGKVLMDVVLYEAYVVRGLPLGVGFDQLLTMSLEDVLFVSGDSFPRRYFDIDPAFYKDTRTFLANVRGRLSGLKFRDDGALDENGRYVFIRDESPQTGIPETEGGPGLNCSGFAKWIVDGILYPVTGKLLAIAPLKKASVKPLSSLAENFAASREPYFGLDWTRNLAMEVYRTLRAPSFARVEEVEVRAGTFASVIDRSRGPAAAKNYPGFLLNGGFSPEGLQPLLYTLAVNEPGYIYLASVSSELGEPKMRQHHHVAVLVPYFNEYGIFQTAVFESAAETSLQAFIGRYPGADHLVNLVRVPVEGPFRLPD